jgi:hypothetical protein
MFRSIKSRQAIPITGFSASDGGDAFVFSARATAGQVFSDEQLRRGFFVTSGHRWEELYLNRRQFDLQHEIYIQTSSMNGAHQVGAIQQTPWNDSLSISPNGAYALLSAFNTDPPAVWDDYEFKSDGDLSYQRSACLAKEVRRCAEQFWLVDLQKKTIKPLLNAPTVHKEGGPVACRLDEEQYRIAGQHPSASRFRAGRRTPAETPQRLRRGS